MKSEKLDSQIAHT